MSAIGFAILGAFASKYLPGIAILSVFLAFLLAGFGSAQLRANIKLATGQNSKLSIESTPFCLKRSPPNCSEFSGTSENEKLNEKLVEGIVDDVPQTANGRTKFTLQATSEQLNGHWIEVRYRVRISSESLNIFPGDRVRARVRLFPPPRQLNPGGADFAKRWQAQGLVASGVVIERQIAILGRPPAISLAMHNFRQKFRLLVQQKIGDEEAAGLVKALAIGDRSDLSRETNDDFSSSGLAHILSVSGLHIAVVAAGIYKLIRWLLARSERLLVSTDVSAIACCCAIPSVWIYVAITGAEIPAVRSGIMTTAIFLATALRRNADSKTALGVALLAVMVYDPAAFHSISFQLSFAAVAGLMLLTRPLRELVPLSAPSPSLKGIRRLLRQGIELLLSTIAGTLAATLVTAPIIAGTFHRASLVAVFANCIGLPVASALTIASAASVALFPFGSIFATPFLWIAGPLAELLIYISHSMASAPYSSIPVPAPSFVLSIAWYALVAAPIHARTSPRFALTIALTSFCVIGFIWSKWSIWPLFRRDLTITYLAVGQGDAALVQLPGGKNMLIDGGGDPGGRYDPGEQIVVPALVELGASNIDVAVLSHPHPDHIKGLISTLKRLPSKELWLARAIEPGADSAELLALARSQSMVIRELSANDRPELAILNGIDNVKIEVLHPIRNEQALGANNASLVLRISIGGISFLFPGDIEEAGEQSLIANNSKTGNGSYIDMHANVLKAPHHGSKTSSSEEFIQAVHPQYVIFSVGNKYGFPHSPVVERYKNTGAKMYRTQDIGAITLKTDGHNLEIRSYLGDN